jgi:hypothetical protein
MLMSTQTSAGGQRQGGLAKTASTYRRYRQLSTQKFPGRRDRRTPQLPQSPAPAPRSVASADGSLVGLLVLCLSAKAKELPARQARRGWALAETWLREYVTIRHAQGAAA